VWQITGHFKGYYEWTSSQQQYDNSAMMDRVTGLVLAGGQGSRLGGADKGLQVLDGRPLIALVLERFAPQVGSLMISANRNADAYRAFGDPVIADLRSGFAGPLAGIEAGMATCRTEWLAAVPCDTPLLPLDLVRRLIAAAEAGGTEAAIVAGHPVFALVRCDLRDALATYLAAGGRKVRDWYASRRTVTVAFDDEAAFANINTPEDLAKLHRDT
jgi:molybdopterin-guanine dinucleotide biosynthesis protein A